MTQPPTLFSQETPVSPQTPDALPGGRKQAPRHTPRWLRYLELSVRVIVHLYLGLFIVLLPWTHFWSDNRLLIFIPHLASVALSGITRGIVSGLGLMNIWIAIHDAIHYKE
jgi:hypothetical protein